LEGRWAGYFTSTGVCAPNGQPLFFISENYFCDATGVALYYTEEELEPEEEEREIAEAFRPGSSD
jgi:hypothetical protein